MKLVITCALVLLVAACVLAEPVANLAETPEIYEDDQEDFVLTDGWLKSAYNKAKNAAKKAVGYTKKGCSYVNRLPVSEMVANHELTAEQVKAGVTEEGLVAAYSAVKAGCGVVG